jgi:hypothetical protein
VAQHQRLGELVVALGVRAELLDHRRQQVERADLGAERSASTPTSPRWSMCWWVMTIRSRSSIRRPCSAQRALELVERLARVRAVSTSVSGSSSIS